MTAPPVQFNIVNTGDAEYVTVFMPGRAPLVASDQHPNYTEIRAQIEQGEYADDPDEFAGLFDVAEAVARKFENLSERVTVSAGRVFFDGDETDDSLTQQIVRFLDEGLADWQPLVAFMENIANNPNDHSRTQLYDWLRRRDFAITEDGRIVAYKGVRDGGDGTFYSLNSGPAIINGQEHTSGPVPQKIGDIVELARSEVAHDPTASCSVGLHVGTFDYARGYARNGAFLKVYVNPRDVVSVPTADSGDKVRVCRYEVAEQITDEDESEVTYAIDQPERRCFVCQKPPGYGEDECTVAAASPDTYVA